MKRWSLRILLCLILLTGGAITTVAVAWGCALAYPIGGDWNKAWVVASTDKLPSRVPITMGVVGVQREFGATQWCIPSESGTQWHYGYGFPAEATIAYAWVRYSFPTMAKEEETSGILRFDSSLTGSLSLPSPVVSFGFAIDTLFYAAIWGGVWFGFVGGKRFIRANRGRCPRCGYDLRGDLKSGCPECGWRRVEDERVTPRTK